MKMYASWFELSEQEHRFFLLLLLLFSTWVMAETESNFDVDTNLTELNILVILNEDDWRSKGSDEEWRKPEEQSDSKVRWGGYSIHQESDQQPGLIPTKSELDTIDRRKPVSQFKMKF